MTPLTGIKRTRSFAHFPPRIGMAILNDAPKGNGIKNTGKNLRRLLINNLNRFILHYQHFFPKLKSPYRCKKRRLARSGQDHEHCFADHKLPVQYYS